jgi:hypothetical protein
MVDGDYDTGGAYWGAEAGSAIYCAHSDDTEIFVRAKNWEDAKAQVEDLINGKIDNRIITRPKDALPDFNELPEFEKAYFTALIWTADENPGSGEYSEDNAAYYYRKLHPETLRRQLEDCQKFQEKACKLLEKAYEKLGYSPSQAGHDFALTRNHAGVGFWDREALAPTGRRWKELQRIQESFNRADYEERERLKNQSLGQKLTRVAQTFHEVFYSLEDDTAYIE